MELDLLENRPFRIVNCSVPRPLCAEQIIIVSLAHCLPREKNKEIRSNEVIRLVSRLSSYLTLIALNKLIFYSLFH